MNEAAVYEKLQELLRGIGDEVINTQDFLAKYKNQYWGDKNEQKNHACCCGAKKWLKEIAIQLQVSNKIVVGDWDYYHNCLMSAKKELEQEGGQ